MKKITILLILLLLVLFASYASNDFYKCSILIDKKLSPSTVNLIQQHSINLSEMEKYNLFEINKSNATVPFVCNLLLGAGIGSFIQGDISGGWTYLIGEVATGILYGYNYVRIATAESPSDVERAASNMVLCSIALLGLRISECIKPFTYAKSYNERLSNALYGAPTIAILPFIDKKGNSEVILSAKVSF